MELNQTFSDRELRKRIALALKRMNQCKEGTSTWHHFRETAEGYQRQLQMPKDQREKFATGSL